MSDGREIEVESADYIDDIPIVRTMTPVFVDKDCGDHHHPLLAITAITDDGTTTLLFDLDSNAGMALLDGRMVEEVKNQAVQLGFAWQDGVQSD